MTNHQSMHAADCCGCGPKHYEYEVWQDGMVKAGGREDDYDSAKSEANHYARMYANDGPVEVRIYEQRLLSTDQIQPKRRRYDPYGSLSEYGIFPECDAQPLEAATPPPQESTMDKQHADDEFMTLKRFIELELAKIEPQWTVEGKGSYWWGVKIGLETVLAKLCEMDGTVMVNAAPTAQAPRACTCPPDDRPDGPCRERYAASECQALASPQQPAEEGERDWLAEAMDTLAEWRFDALFSGKDGLQAEMDKLRREVEEWKSLAEAQVELRDEAEDHAEDLAKALAGLITWIPSADTYRRLGFDPEAPMRALKRAKLSLGGVRSA